jgi:RNA 2',3'-cyclic 3'-phosphodiesterase
MRLFVGLDIPQDIRDRLSHFVDGLRSFAPDIRFVNPETFHITLKFIGDTTKADEIKRALASIHGPSFNVTFAATGYFPGIKSPRVFWAGIQAPPELASLASAIDRAMTPLGFEPERGPYQPHLTLARSGSGRPRPTPGDKPNPKFQRLQQRLSSLPQPDFGTMTAHEFFLYESKLSPRGAQYFKVERYPLG